MAYGGYYSAKQESEKTTSIESDEILVMADAVVNGNRKNAVRIG